MNPKNFFITNGASHDSTSHDGDCPICFSPFLDNATPQPETPSEQPTEPQEPASKLRSCPHAFHSTCLMHWVKQQHKSHELMTCPLCRALVNGPQITAKKVLSTIKEELMAFTYGHPSLETRPWATLDTLVDLDAFGRFLSAYKILAGHLRKLPLLGLPKEHVKKREIRGFVNQVYFIYEVMAESQRMRERGFRKFGPFGMRGVERDPGATLFLECMDKVPNGLRPPEQKFVRACMFDDRDDGIVWDGYLMMFLGRVVALESILARQPPKTLEEESDEEECDEDDFDDEESDDEDSDDEDSDEEESDEEEYDEEESYRPNSPV